MSTADEEPPGAADQHPGDMLEAVRVAAGRLAAGSTDAVVAKVTIPSVGVIVAAMGVELFFSVESKATGQMCDGGWSSRAKAAPAIGAGGDGQISVLCEVIVGLT